MGRGETFGAITSARETEQALAMGFRAIGSSSEYLPDYPGPQCGTTRRWAAAHQDALVRYVRAYVAATEWALQNREAALALYRDATGVSLAVAEEAHETISPDAMLATTGTQRILDLRVALGFLDGPAPPAQRFYDTRYWEMATGRRHP
jgi:ABC-type nitrate/sulfonate/bicarbonate transport system substrate-binding protein